MDQQFLIEQRISEAIAKGELEPPVQGLGQPLNLDAYFSVHPDDRMAYGLLKSSGFLPPEVEWLREMGELRQRIDEGDNTNETRARLAELETSWNLRIERTKQKR
ncbi:MAG: hypothetical protein JWO89_34 [Verrucomicrobiaceae bacterium]|nr:hypothetical protein [Verrucomicrobiaceae bacterium]